MMPFRLATEADRFAEAFGGGEFYVPPKEVLREEVGRMRGGHFKVIHRDTALRADVYLVGDDPLHAWAFGRRMRARIEEFEIWIAPIGYVILRKLAYHRDSGSERHLRDVAMMLQISGDTVDQAEFERWLNILDLGRQLEAAKRHRR